MIFYFSFSYTFYFIFYILFFEMETFIKCINWINDFTRLVNNIYYEVEC